VEQPQGFKDKEHPYHVWRLKKALYGLKQTPRTWYDTLSKFLLDSDFICNKADPSLFIYKNGKGFSDDASLCR